jgi:hypothetical protein
MERGLDVPWGRVDRERYEYLSPIARVLQRFIACLVIPD